MGRRFVRGRIATVVALMLALAGMMSLWREGGAPEAPGLDFYQFWVGGQVAGRRDVASLYDAATRRRLGTEYLDRARFDDPTPRRMDLAQARRDLELFSTPFLYTCFSVFPGKHYDDDYAVFRFLALAAGAAGIMTIAWLLGFSAAQALLIVTFAALLFEPMRSDVRVANVNQLQLAMIAAVLVLQSTRARWSAAGAGVLLGLALAFKPNIVAVVPVIPLVLWREGRLRDLTREMVGLGAGIIAAVLAGMLRFGNAHCWMDWFLAVSALSKITLSRAFGNVAPALPLASRFGPGVSWVCGAVLVAAAIAAVARGAILERDNSLVIAAVGLGLMVYLLSARLVWFHYLILTIPLILALLRPGAADEARPWLRQLFGFLAFTAIAVNPWKPLLHIETIEGETMLLWAGLIGLYAAGIWSLISAESPGVAPAVSERARRRRSARW